MKLSEYLGADNVFRELKELNSDLTFLTDDNVNVMDNLLKLNYGDKSIFSKIAPYSVVMVAEFLSNLHADNWVRLVELNVMQNTLMGGDTRTITETVEETENRNNVTETVNKISAFNTDELIPDDGNNSNVSDNIAGNKTRTLTDSKTNLATQYNNLSLAHKNHIMNVVLNDVKDFLTLSIY